MKQFLKSHAWNITFCGLYTRTNLDDMNTIKTSECMFLKRITSLMRTKKQRKPNILFRMLNTHQRCTNENHWSVKTYVPGMKWTQTIEMNEMLFSLCIRILNSYPKLCLSASFQPNSRTHRSVHSCLLNYLSVYIMTWK